MRALATYVFVVALEAASAAPSWAEDSDLPRFYLHLRGQDTNPATGIHDHWGLSLGANLDRYWGLELSADTFERRVTPRVSIEGTEQTRLVGTTTR